MQRVGQKYRPVFQGTGLNATHPHKKMEMRKMDLLDDHDCNDDAWLLSEEASFLTICDGVVSMRLGGVDGFQLPCEAVRELMFQRTAILRRPPRREELPKMVYEALQNRAEVGSTTVCLAYLSESGALQTFNMGDSGWALLRRDLQTGTIRMIARSRETSTIPTLPGDILIGFTDGMSDNVSDREIVDIVNHEESEHDIARALMRDPEWPPEKPDWVVPFVREWARHHPGRPMGKGGKPDDVTVTVCMIKPGSERNEWQWKHQHSHRRPSALFTTESKSGIPFPTIPTDSQKWGMQGNSTNEALQAAGYAVTEAPVKPPSPRGGPEVLRDFQQQFMRRQQAMMQRPLSPNAAPASPAGSQEEGRRHSDGAIQNTPNAIQQPRRAFTYPPPLTVSTSHLLEEDLESVSRDFASDANFHALLSACAKRSKEQSPSPPPVPFQTSLSSSHGRSVRSLGSSQVPKPSEDDPTPTPEPDEEFCDEQMEKEEEKVEEEGQSKEGEASLPCEEREKRTGLLRRAMTWISRRRLSASGAKERRVRGRGGRGFFGRECVRVMRA
uniref:Protein phosphatase n=1 Tax=Chromera velia CCMP2878 TaxID=1169474 RepID=A0A0G4GRY7_9ALVE|eukprot:Cvel_23126.t1-p1 / transcript=Cvel_23126.t1 / gene=Cvel_23126 / organism=Chromera_velia_CCMP2878 / gene_product=Probable protein phosphatase 2C 1, putative / transcript_product=Probable protein phosphatase 2C 1, putative / location=Cvel_scaffold2349:3096-7892(+) / protein_length=554 / sequence_SO=supercontig / SO=protein_coding / is_pseudo=false